ncbi:unnamed protein product [Mytilus coruscus]|uniref:DZIP3-like HEPN domain-containing protein n=1 Tax=Mytilus coruscus TaxID=42192 RepID=A0A6J8AQT3_MYTCO|nr:unnamed protein product [Mytilus coruscus]
MATASDDNMRCAQCTYVVLNVFPKIMQDLLSDTKETPQSLYHKVMKNKIFRTRLNSSEMNTLQTMSTDGYTKLDVSFMYKIIKFFRLIDPPTRNWGSNPLAHETELGDDVERIRRARNHLVHKFDANISEQEYRTFFEKIKIVSRRLDIHLKKQKDMGYEHMIEEYKLSSLDSKDKEKLLDERRQEECLKQICTCTPIGKETEVHVFAGKTMNDIIDKVKSIAGDYVVPIKIIIHGIDDSADKVEMINALKNELSTKNITIKSAEKNCIILFAETKSNVLQDNSLFLMEINCMIERVFQSCKFICKADRKIYAVVTSAEEEFDHDDLIENDEGGPSIFGDDDSVVLRVDMKNESFAPGERMEQFFSEFFNNIVEKGNGQQFFGKKTVQAILIPESKGHNLRNAQADTPHPLTNHSSNSNNSFAVKQKKKQCNSAVDDMTRNQMCNNAHYSKKSGNSLLDYRQITLLDLNSNSKSSFAANQEKEPTMMSSVVVVTEMNHKNTLVKFFQMINLVYNKL